MDILGELKKENQICVKYFKFYFLMSLWEKENASSNKVTVFYILMSSILFQWLKRINEESNAVNTCKREHFQPRFAVRWTSGDGGDLKF